jgi:ABC-type Fe3+/spermidine/putrescine transport system ATPase subunit
VRGIGKSYGISKDRLVRAADDVSLTVDAGAFVALTGASGSGKSTLLHLIGAIERPDSGTIISNGQDVTALHGGGLAAYRRSVGFVFQSYHLLPALTALDNVIAPLLPYRLDRGGRHRPGDRRPARRPDRGRLVSDRRGRCRRRPACLRRRRAVPGPGAAPPPGGPATRGGVKFRVKQNCVARKLGYYERVSSEALEGQQHPAGLRERKKLATRQALGFAAMRLAVQKGLDNVLVDDIAEAVGVSARTFNNYFASKYEAICALSFDRAMRIGTALLERPKAEPLWEAITNAVMSEFAVADSAPDEEWLAGVRLVTSEPALRGEYLKVHAMSQYSLAEAIGVRAYCLAGTTFPRSLAGAVTAAVQAAMEQWLRSDPPTALAPLIRKSLDELAAGMLSTLPQPARAASG